MVDIIFVSGNRVSKYTIPQWPSFYSFQRGKGARPPVYGRGQNDETVCKIADGGSIHDFGVVKAAPSTRNPQVWGYDFGVVPLPGGVHQGRDRGVNKFQLPVHLAAANVRGIKIQTRFYAELIWGSVTMTTESSPDTCV